MRTVRWSLVHLFDPAQLRAWLEDRSAAGWQLEEGWRFPLALAKFRREEGPCRYWLEPCAKRWLPPEEDERAQLYGELGWTYVCDLRDYRVYRCQDRALPEPYTDRSTQGDLLRHMERYWRTGSVWLGILLLVLLALSLHQGRCELALVYAAAFLPTLVLGLLQYRRSRRRRLAFDAGGDAGWVGDGGRPYPDAPWQKAGMVLLGIPLVWLILVVGLLLIRT